MNTPECYSVETILYDWKHYKRKYYKSISKELLKDRNSPNIHNRLLGYGFPLLLFSFLLMILFSIFSLIFQDSLFLFMEYICIIPIIISTLFICFYVYKERSEFFRKQKYFTYWIPIFDNFITDKYDKNTLEKFIKNYIDSLIRQRHETTEAVQVIFLSIIFGDVLKEILARFELSLLYVLVISLILISGLFIYYALLQLSYSVNGQSNSKLLIAEDFHTLLEVSILMG